MLIKMICKNMDKKNVLLYSFSLFLSAALEMFLGFAFMVNGKYGLHEKAGAMDWVCTMFFLIAGFMAVFFILYATGYYVRAKNKDYSLFLMLGSSRKFIFQFFSVEFLLIYVFSAASGILAGGAVSGMFIVVLGAFQYEGLFSMTDIWQVIGAVVRINVVLFFLELPLIFLYFCKRDLSGMQKRQTRKERKHGITGFLAIVGIGLIACAMDLLKRGEILYHFISMVICLAGIYLFMSFGGSLILMLLKVFKKFYYGHMITLNDFYYRFKSNCRLLFVMFALDFVILFFTGASVISQMPEDVDSPEYPYGFVGVMREGDQKNMAFKMFGNDSVRISAVMGYLNVEDIGVEERGYFCISDREYSRLTDREIFLGDREAVLVDESTAPDSDKPDFLYLNEKDAFSILKVQNEIVFGIEKPDSLREFVVLPESAVRDYRGDGCSIIAKKGDLREEYEQYGDCFQGKEADIFWRYGFLKEANENMIFVRIVSIFTGVFCLFSCFGILALKIQGDLPLLKQKYGILYHLGMSEKSIRTAISSEYRKVLAIPVILSLFWSGIYMFAEMTEKEMFVRLYIGKYIPFQILFVCLNILYFYWMKKVMLQKNAMIIVSE